MRKACHVAFVLALVAATHPASTLASCPAASVVPLPLAAFNPDGASTVGVGFFHAIADNRNDLIFLGQSNGQRGLWIRQSNGDGTFKSPIQVTNVASPYLFAVGPLYHAISADLVVAGADNTGAVTILKGNFDGTFSTLATYQIVSAPLSILAILPGYDFDHDGYADIALAITDGRIAILPGKFGGTFGSPRFTAASELLTAPALTSLSVADFNGDGKHDIALYNGDTGRLWILNGVGDGTFSPPFAAPFRGLFRTANIGGPGDDVIAGDTVYLGPDFRASFKASGTILNTYVKGNGIPILVVLDQGNTISLVPFVGRGLGPPLATYAAGGDPSYGIQSVVISDINGDGRNDLIVIGGGPGGGWVTALLQAEDGTFAAPVTLSSGQQPSFVTEGFFRGSTKIFDLLLILGSQYAVLMGQPCQPVPASASSWQMRLFNVDAHMRGEIANSRGTTFSKSIDVSACCGESGYIDVSSVLVPGANTFHITASPAYDGAHFSYAYQIIQDGLIKLHATCGDRYSTCQAVQQLDQTLSVTNPATASCVPDAYSACVLNRRFKVGVRYRSNFDDNPVDTNALLKPVQGFASSNYETVFFYFNSENNIELLLKMLDQGNTDAQGRPTIAVLFGTATPLRIELSITDTQTGSIKTYLSSFNSMRGETDFTAFLK